MAEVFVYTLYGTVPKSWLIQDLGAERIEESISLHRSWRGSAREDSASGWAGDMIAAVDLDTKLGKEFAPKIDAALSGIPRLTDPMLSLTTCVRGQPASVEFRIGAFNTREDGREAAEQASALLGLGVVDVHKVVEYRRERDQIDDLDEVVVPSTGYVYTSREGWEISSGEFELFDGTIDLEAEEAGE